MIKVGDRVFIKTDAESIGKMKKFFTNGRIINYAIDNPDEIYEVVYKDKYNVVLDKFNNMISRFIPKECVELAENQTIHQIRKESSKF